MFSHLPFSIGSLWLVVLNLANVIADFSDSSVMYFSNIKVVLNNR